MRSNTSAHRTIMCIGKLNTTALACCSAAGEVKMILIGTMYTAYENGCITTGTFTTF